MNRQFEVGQRVKITATEKALAEYAAHFGFGRTGEIEDSGTENPEGLMYEVKLDGFEGYHSRWFKPQHLELIDDPTPQPAVIQYPPLRNVDDNNKPLSTWQQVFAVRPLAASQPHLYILGHYRSDVYDLEQFAKDTPNFILMATIACSNAALGGSETQPYHLVFVITEGA